MKKVERVFAFLGLAWVIDVLFHLIFSRVWLSWYMYCENFWLSLLHRGNPETGIVRWAASLSMMLLAFLAGLVIVWGIKKAQLGRV